MNREMIAALQQDAKMLEGYGQCGCFVATDDDDRVVEYVCANCKTESAPETSV